MTEPAPAASSTSRILTATRGCTIELSVASFCSSANTMSPRRDAVKCAVRPEHAGAERRNHLGQSVGAGRDYLARDEVSVDDHRALGGQAPGHFALAGADAAGQPDS